MMKQEVVNSDVITQVVVALAGSRAPTCPADQARFAARARTSAPINPLSRKLRSRRGSVVTKNRCHRCDVNAGNDSSTLSLLLIGQIARDQDRTRAFRFEGTPLAAELSPLYV
ncbi:hypothetical protein EVAR_47250_1 [Eumeta japonica]|uniref:Uncharacterized protein n=1 Tax=Eumeta variegata TaxID=151549 RepID=A0A4C1XJI8_EUMVA|nr:hypothetical protein EVAR_47250_1 [Eumeta japonica]